MRISLCLLFLSLPAVCLAGQNGNGNGNGKGEARLLRFPTIHGKHIVFGYAGDLYTVDAKGGIARRLTSDEGYEMFPRFSPDGKHVAFTGAIRN